jgi:hypothetical protein
VLVSWLVGQFAATGAAATAPSATRIVGTYVAVEHLVIPDLEAFQTWMTSSSPSARGNALLGGASSLTQDSHLVLWGLRGVEGSTPALSQALALLRRFATDIGVLGEYVDGYMLSLRLYKPRPFTHRQVVALGIVYRDALAAWSELTTLGPAIGAHT